MQAAMATQALIYTSHLCPDQVAGCTGCYQTLLSVTLHSITLLPMNALLVQEAMAGQAPTRSSHNPRSGSRLSRILMQPVTTVAVDISTIPSHCFSQIPCSYRRRWLGRHQHTLHTLPRSGSRLSRRLHRSKAG